MLAKVRPLIALSHFPSVLHRLLREIVLHCVLHSVDYLSAGYLLLGKQSFLPKNSRLVRLEIITMSHENEPQE